MRRPAPLVPAALVLLAFAFVLVLNKAEFIHSDDARLLSVFERRLPHPEWPADFVAVSIDDPAVDARGRWPWSRGAQAELLERVHALGARTILYDVQPAGATSEAEDGRLARAIAEGRAILPISVRMQPATLPGEHERLLARRMTIEPLPPARVSFPPDRLALPFAPFDQASLDLGHIWFPAGADDTVGTHLPFLAISSAGGVVPSLALTGVLRNRGLDPRAVRMTPDSLLLPGAEKPLELFHGVQLLDAPTAPPTISAAAVLDPAQDAVTRPRIEGRLVLVFLDQLAWDRVNMRSAIAVPGGWLTALAVRAIEMGTPFHVIPLADALLPLLAILLIASVFSRRTRTATLAVTTISLSALWILFAGMMLLQAHTYVPAMSPAILLLVAGACLSGDAARFRAATAEARADAGTAPTGNVAIVFTDVESSTALWEAAPDAMREALAIHQTLIRRLLTEANGYEVKTEGDSFMLVFKSSFAAVAWCLAAQEALLQAGWPAGVLRNEHASEVRAFDGTLLWRGLRVRMGVHSGAAEARVDPLTGRMDYFGTVVNRAARVASAAYGGQILVSGAVWEEIGPSLAALPTASVRDLGETPLKGLLSPERLVELLPAGVAERSFPDGRPSVSSKG